MKNQNEVLLFVTRHAKCLKSCKTIGETGLHDRSLQVLRRLHVNGSSSREMESAKTDRNMDATNELDRQDQGVTTFWDAVTHEDTRDSIKQLGYTLKGPNGENKYSVYMMEKKIGTMTHEPEKAKWFITKSLTSCWFITFLNELVMDKNNKNGVTVAQGSTSIVFPKRTQYETMVTQVEAWMRPLSTAKPLEATGGTGDATRDKRFLVFNDDQNVNDWVTVTVCAGRSKEAKWSKRVLLQGQAVLRMAITAEILKHRAAEGRGEETVAEQHEEMPSVDELGDSDDAALQSSSSSSSSNSSSSSSSSNSSSSSKEGTGRPSKEQVEEMGREPASSQKQKKEHEVKDQPMRESIRRLAEWAERDKNLMEQRWQAYEVREREEKRKEEQEKKEREKAIRGLAEAIRRISELSRGEEKAEMTQARNIMAQIESAERENQKGNESKASRRVEARWEAMQREKDWLLEKKLLEQQKMRKEERGQSMKRQKRPRSPSLP